MPLLSESQNYAYIDKECNPIAPTSTDVVNYCNSHDGCSIEYPSNTYRYIDAQGNSKWHPLSMAAEQQDFHDYFDTNSSLKSTQDQNAQNINNTSTPENFEMFAPDITGTSIETLKNKEKHDHEYCSNIFVNDIYASNDNIVNDKNIDDIYDAVKKCGYCKNYVRWLLFKRQKFVKSTKNTTDVIANDSPKKTFKNIISKQDAENIMLICLLGAVIFLVMEIISRFVRRTRI
jgi:hypothetical protein